MVEQNVQKQLVEIGRFDLIALIIREQTNCLYWGTNRLPLLGDKQADLSGGQTGCPYWGTDRLSLLGDKQVAFKMSDCCMGKSI